MRVSQERHTAQSSWMRPLLLATTSMALLIAGLVALGRRHSDADSPLAGSKPPLAGNEQSASASSTERQSRQAPRSPRHALPDHAWLVADIDLSFLREENTPLPRALEDLDCQRVDPPERLAVALWPGDEKGDSPEESLNLAVSATEASASFLACARERMTATGAQREVWPEQVEVLSRPSGLRLFIQEQRGLVVFVSALQLSTADLLEVIQGTRPNAAQHGQHGMLLGSLDERSGLTVTLSLPPNWMEGLVDTEEASRSPLRFLRASAWSLDARGLRGIVDCNATPDGEGRRALAGFLEGVREDLLSPLSLSERERLRQTWSLEAERATRLELRWDLSSTARATLLSRLLPMWR